MFHVYRPVFKKVWPVIELEGHVEGIAVDDEAQSRQTQKDEYGAPVPQSGVVDDSVRKTCIGRFAHGSSCPDDRSSYVEMIVIHHL